jgi:hypothetical protein
LFSLKTIINGLVTAKEVAKAINAEKYGFSNLFGLVINEVLKISTLNKFYDRNKHLKDIDFLNAIVDDLQIKFEIPDEDLKDYPKKVLTLLYLTIHLEE